MKTEAEQRKKQALRMRRLLMAIASYGCTLTVVLASFLAGLLPGWVAAVYFAYVVVANGVLAILILANYNLKFARPDMTLLQIASSILPGLLVLFFAESPQVRGAFLLLAIVPLVFGILGLNRRRSVLAGLVIFGGFVFTYLAIWLTTADEVLSRGDAILVLAFFFCVTEISLLGGHISSLQRALGQSNRDLNEALEKIADLAVRDELTGVFNRRHLLAKLEEEMERSRRGSAEFSLAMIDIDHFKSINDTCGHTAGDRVLVKVAQEIAGSIRRIDHFGRFGGEEFMLIMPGTGYIGALQKLDRLRCQVAGLEFKGEACGVKVTISVGVVTSSGVDELAEMIKQADVALYAAKGRGRNCVVAAEALATPSIG